MSKRAVFYGQLIAVVFLATLAVYRSDALATQGNAPAKKLLPRWREHIAIERAQATSPNVTHRLHGKIGYDDEHTQKILAPLAGRVTRVFVTLGSEVKRGDPLFELDAPELAAIAAQQIGSELDVKQSEAASKRADALFADGAISAQEAALAHAQLKKAHAEHARLLAHLTALSLGPLLKGRARLVAQQDGRVAERHVHQGQQLRGDESEPLLILSDLRHVWVLAELHEQDAIALPATGNIIVRTPAQPHRSFFGRIEAKAETLDGSRRTLLLRGSLKNPALELKPGMAASIELQLAPEGVWVSQKAVLFDAEGPYVVLVEHEDEIRRADVVLGIASAGFQQILSGLEPNASIVGQGALLIAQAFDL